MRFYLDTEFIERGHEHPIELISLGLVGEDGSEYYTVLHDGWDAAHASPWVKENVLSHLGYEARSTRAEVATHLLRFCGENPQFYGYYSAYDWVLFCQLFGTMVDLPRGWPRFCRDIIQLCKELGNIPLPKQEGFMHHALHDARHVKRMHEFLLGKRGA